MFRTAVGQLLWVSQLRADISFAVKELSKEQQPDNEDWTNLKRLLSTMTKDKSQSHADSDWAGCSSTRKTTSGAITSCWEAELYAMEQATIEPQHIKQVIEELAVPNLSTRITMSINTDNSAGKAVARRLGLNKKTKHVQLRVLYIQDIVQHGQLTINQIPTSHNPADILTKHLPSATILSHHDQLCLQTTATAYRQQQQQQQ
eukprot:4106867-Amphidinium_carterae.5